MISSLVISSVMIILKAFDVDALTVKTSDKDYIDAPFTIFEYSIHVTPYLNEPDPHFSGSVLARFLCHRISNVIELHSKHLTISSFSLVNDETRLSVPIASFSENPAEERIKFSTGEPLEPGTIYSLGVDYEGLLNRDGPTIGVFSVNYTNSHNSTNDVHRMMGTTLRPNHARSLFPCIDSPDHKARFRVSVTREIGMKALTNTALLKSVSNGSWTTDTFEMTEYLAPFHLVIVLFPVGDWVVSSSVDAGGVSCDLWMTNQSAANGHEALRYVERDIEFMEEFTGIPMSFRKMDFFAFKQYHTSAFEHPGLITVKTSVVRKPSKESFDYTAKTLAHELGHQWFGNLVTVKTWGDLWIAEGLTCFVSFKAMKNHHEYFTEFATTYHVGQLLIMRREKEPTTLPLYQTFADRPSYHAVYQPLTWVKGQAVATVLENYVGDELFRDVLRAALRDNRWGTLSVWELLEYLESASEGFSAALAWQWFASTGYPLVTVTRSKSRLIFRCHLLNGEDDRSTWPVTLDNLEPFHGPLKLGYVLKYLSGDAKRGALTFTGEETELSLPLQSEDIDYFMANTDGFYVRVLYDDSLWQKLIANINHLLEFEEGVLSLTEDASILYQYGLMEGDVFGRLSHRYCYDHEDDYVNSYSYESSDFRMPCWRLWSMF